ncbi:MAG: hypothetical protein C0501_03400 [Isosphaera sp.]|nr:hypothetical protein [Isosphaera sp.]
MTGTVVRSEPRVSLVAVLFLVLAGLCVAGAVAAQTVHLAVLALLPGVMGLCALVSTDPAVRFEVRGDGLGFEAPDGVFVRYDDIEGLTAARDATGDEFEMLLYHPGGVVRIPPRLSVSSRALYKFLMARLPPPGCDPEAVPRPLAGWAGEQVELFGRDRVFVYAARRHPPASTSGGHVLASVSVALAGLAVVAAAVVLGAVLPGRNGRGGWDEMIPWCILGMVLVLLGSVFAVAYWLARRSGQVKNWRGSCLVVSPGGIALVQGPLKGKMRWDELRAVEYPSRPRFGLTSAGGAAKGIGLLVEGAYLVVADYYDRPLAVIYSNLRAYWGGRDAN